MTEADFAAVPGRDGVRVVNVTPGAGGPGPGQAGWWLRGAAVALGVLAAAAAAVSWDAQYAMVRAVKPVPVVAALEAGIPDVGAVVFAALGRGAGPARQAGAALPGAERRVHRDLARHERAGGRARLAGPGDLGDARGGLRASRRTR